jgi:hypothetical protein
MVTCRAQQQRETFTLGRGQRWSALDEPVDVLIETLAVVLPAALS